MDNIQVLDRDTANRIAAGEVVERPASVIKELVENAIDARSTAITIEARDAGGKYMRVTDNGVGIRAGDVRVAFERHATSKLCSGDPLTDIRTMGFRGEALPSIAAVAKVEMRTRQSGALSGVSIRVEGGEVCDIREAGCPEGTTVVVQDLFFNTPARLKFLKRPQTETAVLCEAVAQLAMSHPDIAFRMVLNGRVLYHTPGDGDLRRLAALVNGIGAPDTLLEVSGTGGIGIRGLLGIGDNGRATRSGETFFINGRVVLNRQLSVWVEEACRERLTVSRYPYCALFMDLPVGSVDVNVHPNKLEVRFTDEYSVRDALIGAVREAVLSNGNVVAPKAEATDAMAAPQREKRDTAFVMPAFDKPPVMHEAAYAYRPERPIAPLRQTKIEPYQVSIDQAAVKQPEKKKHTLIGQLFDLYLLLYDDEAFYMVDQHAAHERILYDRMTAAERDALSQLLLEPFLMELSVREMALVEEHAALLADLGYELSAFGATTLRVSAVPVVLGEASGRLLMQDIIGMLDVSRRVTTVELMREQLISAACKHAVKDGDTLDAAQMDYILDKVLKENTPLTCPHGRPVLIKMTKTELEKLFKRL